jgi:hypothetical protein
MAGARAFGAPVGHPAGEKRLSLERSGSRDDRRLRLRPPLGEPDGAPGWPDDVDVAR